MAQGTVKWFNPKKGYGFIEQDGSESPDVFVHWRSICADGFKSLREGERVEFELEHSEKGVLAAEVRSI